MGDRIVAIKAELFDIIEAQERLQVKIHALQDLKMAKAKELDAAREEQPEPEAKE